MTPRSPACAHFLVEPDADRVSQVLGGTEPCGPTPLAAWREPSVPCAMIGQPTNHERRVRATMTVLSAVAAVDKFEAPLYTQAEASRFLGLSESTFRNWALGYRHVIGGREVTGAPILTAFGGAGHRGPNIPFVGLAEGYALAAIRKSGAPLQRIRPALEQLNTELGLDHALASKKLYTDGAEVLFDYAEKTGGGEGDAVRELVVVRNNQRVFADVVEGYLRRIEFGADGFASAVPLPGFRKAQLVADV